MRSLEHLHHVPPSPTTTGPGSVTGRPRLVLRAEGGVLLLAALVAFAATDEPWWLVPAVLFLPDLSFAGYAGSTRLGALTYNLAHSYPLPAVLGAVGLWQDSLLTQALAVVWFAHIGMDRLLGYGLKHDDGFTHTHLGDIGRPRRPPPRSPHMVMRAHQRRS
jgi:hypothetical protein